MSDNFKLLGKDDSSSTYDKCQIVNDFNPAKMDIQKGTFLKPCYFVLNNGFVFQDKSLPNPDPSYSFSKKSKYDQNYFVDLHFYISSFNKYNHLGARKPLVHSKINVSKFRELLPRDYDDISVLQYLEFGFPLGLVEDFILKPVTKNHSSAYEYFTHVDKFITSEIEKGGITGPFKSCPFNPVMVSPLMTSVKKPNSRRTVFDASFSDFSLNLNTPEKVYLGEDYDFCFPKLDDFASLILASGKGCFLWKRDLSRFFLQLPLDPIDYDKVACIWRGELFIFTSYIWGCRHAGLNGQRVTNAVSFIHKSLGLFSNCIHKPGGCEENCLHYSLYNSQLLPFNTLNYSDDFADVAPSLERSTLSFNLMGSLLQVLGLAESLDKAVSPTQVLTYLGVEFDTVKLEMRINSEKCQELSFELIKWARKTVATKADLQSILGKLLWISRVVKFSRCFVIRIIDEIKKLKKQNQKITLSNDIRKDFLWWETYMAMFNGIHLLVPTDISEQLAGDACPMGFGSWYPNQREYFSSKFPQKFQDPQIPIHIKEFIVVILAIKKWGRLWAGKRVNIFCDNDSVCDVIFYLKPKDEKMQIYLREFLFYVCLFNFHPVVSKISSKENDVSDFLSRNFSDADAKLFFLKENLPSQTKVEVDDSDFLLRANW